MKIKSLLLVATMCLAGNSLLTAKTRIFTVAKTVECGNARLAPGTYKMRVHGDKAEITDLNHFADKKPVSVAITTETGDQRFPQTTVQATSEGDVYRVNEIDLSRSSTVVEFR